MDTLAKIVQELKASLESAEITQSNYFHDEPNYHYHEGVIHGLRFAMSKLEEAKNNTNSETSSKL